MNDPYFDAERILGEKFLSPEMVTSLNLVDYDKDDIGLLRQTINSRMIETCRLYGMFLIPAPPRSVTLKGVEHMLKLDLHLDPSHQSFFADRVDCGVWLAISQKVDCLKIGPPAISPNAAVVVWFLGLYKRFGFFPFINKFIETSSIDTDGDKALVGCVNGGVIYIPNILYPGFNHSIINVDLVTF